MVVRRRSGDHAVDLPLLLLDTLRRSLDLVVSSLAPNADAIVQPIECLDSSVIASGDRVANVRPDSLGAFRANHRPLVQAAAAHPQGRTSRWSGHRRSVFRHIIVLRGDAAHLACSITGSPEPEPEQCVIRAVGGDCRVKVVWDKRQLWLSELE